jgi:hypothetical protein
MNDLLFLFQDEFSSCGIGPVKARWSNQHRDGFLKKCDIDAAVYQCRKGARSYRAGARRKIGSGAGEKKNIWSNDLFLRFGGAARFPACRESQY